MKPATELPSRNGCIRLLSGKASSGDNRLPEVGRHGTLLCRRIAWMVARMLESSLYPFVHDFIEQRFRAELAPRYGELHTASAITATTKGGTDDGRWSRPDLALAAVRRFKFDATWTLDLHSFEVKTSINCDPTSVHEALSHTSLVHFTWLTWHQPDFRESDQLCRQIHDRCARHGVGLITFDDPSNSDSFMVRLRSARHSPDPESIDEFIETRFDEHDRKQLQAWLRRVE